MTDPSVRPTRGLQYERLASPTHIRLLRRLGSDNSGQIPCHRFEFESHNLPSSPDFTALSYTWGSCVEIGGSNENNEEQEYLVECNGQRHPVTENLFDFLNTVGQDFLWIDALCINQKDDDEKADQVSLMGQIYAAAHIVIMWLGNDTSDLDEFVFLHDKFLPELDQRGMDVYGQSLWDLAFLKEIGIDSVEQWQSYWLAYFRFYRRRRFFSRAWIVQEYVLGRNQIFFCGRTALHPNQMIRLSYYMTGSAWGQDIAYLDFDVPNMVLFPMEEFSGIRGTVFEEREDSRDFRVTKGGVEGVWLRRIFESVSGATTPEARWFCFLLLLVERIRSLSATDPKDKIYSILGLANLQLPKSLPPPIRPNYRLSTEEVYTSVSAQIIQSIPFLTLLSCVQELPEHRNQNLQSWVPDYSCERQCTPLVWLGGKETQSLSGDETEHTQPVPGSIYNTSLANASVPSFREICGDALVVTGAYFDRVEEVSDMLEKVSVRGGIFTLLKLCTHLDPVYTATGQPRIEALWRTMIADVDDGKCPAPDNIGECFRDFIMCILCHCLTYYRSESQLIRGGLQVLDVLHDSEPSSALPKSSEVLQRTAALHDEFQEVLRTEPNRFQTLSLFLQSRDYAYRFLSIAGQVGTNRSLYRTSNGYLGLGPCSAMEGDEIWLLRGALVPFVMRRHTNQGSIRLVGESYLHGFMQGEMLTPELEARIEKISIL